MTRDDAIRNWNDAAARTVKGENHAVDMLLAAGDALIAAALRAPAVTGEADAQMLLRREWWIGHGHGMAVLYGDDGEMQCHECRVWDYRRAPLAELQEQVREARIAKLAAAPPAAGAPPALVALEQHARMMQDMGGTWHRAIPWEFVERAAWSPAPAPVAPPTDGSVMVRVDPVYVEQMRGDGLAGPFSRITLDERDGVPTLLLTAAPKPTPDTAEWWRAVAQELGVEIHKLKLAAQSVPSDLVQISQPGHSVVRVSQPGQSPAPVAPPADAVARVRAIAKESARLLDETADRFISMGEAFAPPAVAGGDAPPEIQVDDVLVSKSGNRWRVQAVSGSHLLLHNVPEEAPRARGTVAHHEALPEWAAAIERNGGVIWRRRQEGQ